MSVVAAAAPAGRKVAAKVTRVTEDVRARRAVLKELKTLDPEVDNHRMTQLALGCVFSDAFFHQALFSVAYYRQVAVKTIAPIIARRGYGDTLSNLTKRNDDSLLFFGLIYRDGPNHPEGQRTIDRLSAIHKTFDIQMNDYRYTIASLCFEPVRLPQIIGVENALTPAEQRAIFLFWRGVGREWGVDIPEEQDEFRQWFYDYEVETYAYSEEAHNVALKMEEAFTDRFTPGRLKWIGSHFLRSLCDQPLLDAVGFEPAHPAMRRASILAVKAYLKARRALPGPVRPTDNLIKPWTREYGKIPDSSEVGPKWALEIQVEPRATAGKCPF